MGSARAVVKIGSNSIEFEGTEEFVQQQISNPLFLDRCIQSMNANKSGPTFNRDALDHSWQWFKLHAGQRMQGVNFFLVAATFLSAAFVTAIQNHRTHVAVAIAVFGVFISICFYRLELRVRQLIHAGEAAMKPFQAQLAETCAISDLRILEKVEHTTSCLTKYSHIIRFLHWSSALLFGLGAIYGLLLS